MSALPSSLPLDARLPWLEPLQRALDTALQSDRVGHALLLQVAPGLGGEWLAIWLAARLFCTQLRDREYTAGITPLRSPCGECLACRRVQTDEQPDLIMLRPIEDSREIRIDQVRELVGELTLTSHAGGRKLAIITPADKLNRAAANALLKTLEEPTTGSLLVLVTGEPSRLPVTVLSRCTRLQLPLPSSAELREWLQHTGGQQADWEAVLQVLGAKPLEAMTADTHALVQLQRETVRALEQAAAGSLDPVETAESWGKEDYALRVACIESWLIGRIRAWARAPGAARVAGVDDGLGGGVGSASADSRVQTLFLALDETREARQWADTPINKPLALERLLWRLNSLASGSAVPSRRPA